MLKRICLVLIVACLMAGCSQGQGKETDHGFQAPQIAADSLGDGGIPSQQSSHGEAPPASLPEASSQTSSDSAAAELNPSTSQSHLPESGSEALAYDEQALEAELAYLSQALSESQHGGLHRISDYNGSGRTYHGGDDKADPYILVWVVDKNAVDAALNSYTGQRAEVVYAQAAYSLEQLGAVKHELETGDVAHLINSVYLSEDNKVVLDIMGEDNLSQVNDYLSSYQSADAVAVFAR